MSLPPAFRGSWEWLVKNLGTVVLIVGGGTWLTVQFVQAQETNRKVEHLQQDSTLDHDRLIRIEQDVHWLRDNSEKSDKATAAGLDRITQYLFQLANKK